MKYFTILIVLFILFTGSIGYAQQKYAILISTGNTAIDDTMYHSEYWYDMFLVYRSLIEDGYTHNNIFVLYGNGNDFASNHAQYQTATVFPGVGQISDFAVSRANIQDIFTWLQNGNVANGIPQIQQGDSLFFWWMGHGSWDGDDASGNHLYHADIATTNEDFNDNEFADVFNQLPACLIKTVFVMTCHSGGLLDDIEGLHMTAQTSSRYDENSFSDMYDVEHAELSYHLASALREQDASGIAVVSDTNADTLVSVKEAQDYITSNVALSHPVVSDYRNIGLLIFTSDANPVAGIPNSGVYSRDHENDNGTIPSNTEVWYEGPDLWVRNFEDGGIEHQNAEFGQPNFIYSRIHNIGCATCNVNVTFSWCEMSAWANPASWNTIFTVPVNALVSNETRVVSTEWDTVPAPGKYCLHTVLDAPGDPPNANGISYLDNNKVQLNFYVVDNVPNWSKKIKWFLENGINKKVKIDLVIEKIKFSGNPEMFVIIPPDIHFEKAFGGKVLKTRTGNKITFMKNSKRIILKGVVLKAKEKRECILNVILPKKAPLGQVVSVKITEDIKGKSMGGIVFNVRSATEKRVAEIMVRRLVNFFNVVSKKFKITEAKRTVDFNKNILKKIEKSGTIPEIASFSKNQLITAAPISKLLGKNNKDFIAAIEMIKAETKKDNMNMVFESLEDMMDSTKQLFIANKK